MMIVPELPMTSSTTPFQPSRPARVTTNEGTPILATKKPCISPIAAPVPSAATIASQVGTFLPGSSSTAATTPPMPLTYPIERSISPSSSTNTMPMPMIVIAAIWANRFTKLSAVRKWELRDWK